MAKIGSIERNNKRKRLVKSLAAKRQELKSKIYSKDIAIDERFNLILKLASASLGMTLVPILTELI